MNTITCVSCGKTGLVRNEIGINKKLLGEDIEKFYCLDCLAEYLEVTPQDILDKIDVPKERKIDFYETLDAIGNRKK